MSVVDSITNTNTTKDGNTIITTSHSTEFNPYGSTFAAVGLASSFTAIMIIPYAIVGGLGIYLIYRFTKK